MNQYSGEQTGTSLFDENPTLYKFALAIGIVTSLLQSLFLNGNASLLSLVSQAIGSFLALIAFTFVLGYIPVQIFKNKIEGIRMRIYGPLFMLLSVGSLLGSVFRSQR